MLGELLGNDILLLMASTLMPFFGFLPIFTLLGFLVPHCICFKAYFSCHALFSLLFMEMCLALLMYALIFVLLQFSWSWFSTPIVHFISFYFLWSHWLILVISGHEYLYLNLNLQWSSYLGKYHPHLHLDLNLECDLCSCFLLFDVNSHKWPFNLYLYTSSHTIVKIFKMSIDSWYIGNLQNINVFFHF